MPILSQTVDSGGKQREKGGVQNGRQNEKNLPAGFVPSKWETLDPDEVQAQAITSKWELFDQKKGAANPDDDDDDDIDGKVLLSLCQIKH